MWQHARVFLQALLQGFEPSSCEQLGHSPFFALSELAGLSQRWPRHFARTVSAFTLNQALTQTSLPDAALGPPASFAEWVAQFVHLLEAAGWPQSGHLRSGQFQAVQAIEQALATFQAEPEHERMPAARALTLLDGCLQQQLFEPERRHTDILILGLLETTGLKFSHLWVCGLDENNFPGKSLANPF